MAPAGSKVKKKEKDDESKRESFRPNTRMRKDQKEKPVKFLATIPGDYQVNKIEYYNFINSKVVHLHQLKEHSLLSIIIYAGSYN